MRAGVVSTFQSSLSRNQIGDAMMKEVQAALEYKPTPDVLAEYLQERERLLWQSFMWRPNFLCHHQLCRPQAQLVVYTVLCVEARLYLTMGQDDTESPDEDDDWENRGLSYIPTELWYIILSFLRTSELGI